MLAQNIYYILGTVLVCAAIFAFLFDVLWRHALEKNKTPLKATIEELFNQKWQEQEKEMKGDIGEIKDLVKSMIETMHKIEISVARLEERDNVRRRFTDHPEV